MLYKDVNTNLAMIKEGLAHKFSKFMHGSALLIYSYLYYSILDSTNENEFWNDPFLPIKEFKQWVIINQLGNRGKGNQ